MSSYARLSRWMGLTDSRKLGPAITIVHTPELGETGARFTVWLRGQIVAQVTPGGAR